MSGLGKALGRVCPEWVQDGRHVDTLPLKHYVEAQAVKKVFHLSLGSFFATPPELVACGVSVPFTRYLRLETNFKVAMGTNHDCADCTEWLRANPNPNAIRSIRNVK